MIRKAAINDAKLLAMLAVQMWKSHTVTELENSFAELIVKDDVACFLRYEDNRAVAFAKCGLRYDYVEGTDTSPVGYLEGVFVTKEYRQQGIAKELLLECEKWAKEKGCSEFASDCELDNEESLKFHIAVGFCEANRIICFNKRL